MKFFGFSILVAVTVWMTLFDGRTWCVCAETGQEIAALTRGWEFGFVAPPSSHDIFEKTEFGPPKKIQWRYWDPKQTLKPEPGKTLWLKKTLNELDLSAAALFLPRYSAFRGFEIYLDHKSIFQSGTLHPSLINRHLYIQWHLVPLPTDYFGRTLYFRFFSDHHHIIGFHSPIYLGAAAAILNRMVLDELDITIVGLLMIIGGLFGGIFFVVYYRFNSLPFLYASAAAVSAGMYALTESNVTFLMFDDHPIMLSYVHYITLFLFAAGLLAFMEQSAGGGWKKFYQWAATFQIAYVAAAILLDLWQIVSWDMLFNTGLALLGLSIVATEFQLFRTAVAGDRESRLLCLGLGLFGLSGVWDILVGLRVLPLHHVMFPWGLVSLMTSLGWVLVFRYQAERHEAAQTIRKSEERFRNLFENAPISILEVDFNSDRPRVIRVNKSALNLFGLTAGNPERLLLKELLSKEAMGELYHAVNSPGPGSYTAMGTACLRLNQTSFPARVGASRTALFGLGRVVLTIEDMTEEKERRSEEEAIVEERRRIAREIHDGLAQDLAVMNMKASVWTQLSRSHPERMAGEIGFFQQMLKKNIFEVSRCILPFVRWNWRNLAFLRPSAGFSRISANSIISTSLLGSQGTRPSSPHALNRRSFASSRRPSTMRANMLQRIQ